MTLNQEETKTLTLHAEFGSDVVITGTKGKIVIPNFIEQTMPSFMIIRENVWNHLKSHASTEQLMGVLDHIRSQWGLKHPGGK